MPSNDRMAHVEDLPDPDCAAEARRPATLRSGRAGRKAAVEPDVDRAPDLPVGRDARRDVNVRRMLWWVEQLLPHVRELMRLQVACEEGAVMLCDDRIVARPLLPAVNHHLLPDERLRRGDRREILEGIRRLPREL